MLVTNSNIRRQRQGGVYHANIRTGNLLESIISEFIKSAKRSEVDHTTLFVKNTVSNGIRTYKIVNNKLRSSILVRTSASRYNGSQRAELILKRFRKNTVDDFAQPRHHTTTYQIDLAQAKDRQKLLYELNNHMVCEPWNYREEVISLPIKTKNFSELTNKCLYAFQIYEKMIEKDEKDVLNSVVVLSLVSNKMTSEIRMVLKDIVNFTYIEDLVGKWIVMNHKGACKIKTKDEIYRDYRVIDEELS